MKEKSFLREWGIIEGNKQTRRLDRDDLLRLIQENGGSAEYLDLSGLDMRRIDLRGLDLSKTLMMGCNLEGAIAIPMVTTSDGNELHFSDLGYEIALTDWYTGNDREWVGQVQATSLDGAILSLANLSRSDFRWANIRGGVMARCELKSADFSFADLSKVCFDWSKLDETILEQASVKGATLKRVRIMDSDFSCANLQDADLSGAYISRGTKLGTAIWDKNYISILERREEYQEAIELYQMLMEWHETAGLRNKAGKFYYRKRESQRKANQKSLVKDLKELGGELSKVWRIFKSK